MALRNIVTEENEMLYKRSRTVVDFNSRLWDLLDDMKDTMYENNGIGLAAVQVGVLRRVVVMDIEYEGNIIELINPEIIETSEEIQNGKEGCLSFPNKFGLVERPFKLTYTAQDRNGKVFTETVTGLHARCICHELDHLDGNVFVDKATNLGTAEDYSEEYIEESAE